MQTKSKFAALLLVALVFAFSSCAKGSGAKEVVVGVAGAHSGDLASYGLPSVNAVKLVADEINAAGGIDGKMIRLVIEDDQCKPEVATNTATKLVGDQVVAVIGHICSGATKAALGIYNDSDIVCISPSATNPPLTQSGDYPAFFRTIAPDDAQAKLDVDFATDKLGLKKIAVIHDKADYGKGFAEFAKSFIEAGGKAEVVLFEGITPSAVDYSAIINKIQAAGADGIIYGGYHPEASKIVTQMKKKGMDIPFISDDGVKDDTFIKVAGEFAEGVYASGPIDTSSSPIAQKAIKAHQDKFGTEHGAFYINAYAAAQALFNAIDKADSTDAKKIAAALRSEKVDTTLGTISFDDKGDAIGIGFAIYQVQNGVYVELK